MSGWPEWFDNRPCRCEECRPGPGIDWEKKHKRVRIQRPDDPMRFIDDRIQMFLEAGWSIVSESESPPEY